MAALLTLSLAGCGGGGSSGNDTGTPKSPTLSGTARIHGQTDNSGITVSLDGLAVATTDSAGRYAFSDVTEGVHTVTLAHAGQRTVTHDVSTRSGGYRMPDITLLPTDAGVTGPRRPLPVSPGTATVWNFDNPANRLAAAKGPALLDYRDPTGSGWGQANTGFTTATINGITTNVMVVPATHPDQGYTVTHNSLPNGVFGWDGYVSNYTLVMDVMWPDTDAPYRSLYQTDLRNADDADMFALSSGGQLSVGISGNYRGEIAPGTWHRIAVAVQCGLGAGGTGQLSVYVDGAFVRGGNTPGPDPAADTTTAPRCRWALGPEFHLFTDNDGDTATTYISSLMYVDRFMSAADIQALGGPNALGADKPGSAPHPLLAAARSVINFAHRGQGAHAPENTLAALRSAFEAGIRHAEADVRFTKDNVPVLMHDALVNRTTNGTGSVSQMTLAELQQLDAGSWLDPRYTGERVPTLRDAVALANSYGAKLLLDVKVPLKAQYIKAALDSAGVTPDMLWIEAGNSDAAAQDFKANLPGAGVLWMVVPASDAEFARLQAENGVVGFDVDVSNATPALVTAAHDHGMVVFGYTAMDPDTMRTLIAADVDGIETDYSLALQSMLP